MGVRSLPSERWLQHDDRRDDDLFEKDRLTAQHPRNTFVALPGSETASERVRDLVAADLASNGWELRSCGTHPLETAGRSVQEDLCLMELVAGRWVMTAGSVCFPTRWDLLSKLGRSLAEIHLPVPGFEQQLSGQVERFFDRMSAGSLAHRLNWSLVGTSDRRLDARVRQAPAQMPDDPGRQLFIRMERQTLRRLDDHDAIVFGIRIHAWPLGDVAAELPAEKFAKELETMPIAVAEYKNLDGMREQLVEWLLEDKG